MRYGRFGRPWPPRPPVNLQAKKNERGLNENYGRELMELHTLGVDGGYTQKDVTEVARAFTGWTIDRPRLGGGFRFGPRQVPTAARSSIRCSRATRRKRHARRSRRRPRPNKRWRSRSAHLNFNGS